MTSAVGCRPRHAFDPGAGAEPFRSGSVNVGCEADA